MPIPSEPRNPMDPNPTPTAISNGAGTLEPCDACGAQVIWARMKDGNVEPISLTIKYGGDILLFRSGDGVLEARRIPEHIREELGHIGVPRRKHHEEDCSGA